MRSAFHFNFCSFFFAYLPLPLDFSLLYVSSNPVRNQLCKVMNCLEVIGLFFCKGGSKDVFLSPTHFFQKVFECIKLLQI